MLLKGAVSCMLFHTIFPIQDRGWLLQQVFQIACKSKAGDTTSIEHSQVEVAFIEVHVVRHHQSNFVGEVWWAQFAAPFHMRHHTYVSGFHFVLLKGAVSCMLFHTIFPIQDRGWLLQQVFQIACKSKAGDTTSIEHSQVEVAFIEVHVVRHHQH